MNHYRYLTLPERTFLVVKRSRSLIPAQNSPVEIQTVSSRCQTNRIYRLSAPTAPHKPIPMPSRFATLVVTASILVVCGCAAPSTEKPKTSGKGPTPTGYLASDERPAPGAWKPLFNGKDLTGWTETKFGGAGEPTVENGNLIIAMGAGLSGVNWTNAAAIPKINYEIELEAMKLDGNDFFCGLTFPVAGSSCTLVLGGWGGSVAGLSSLDGLDASENETTKNLYFEPKKWFRIGLLVTDKRIAVRIDGTQVMDVETTGKKIDLRQGEIYMSKPLGVATYQTSSALRNIRIRDLGAKQ